MFLSNEGASKVLGLLGIRISNDTIQRLYDRIGFVDNPYVEEVGIDDVAIRKGQTYATAIYDLKDHHLIALLEGREGEPLRKWLEHHQKIRLAARDRASAYAAAISAVLPDCVQVADCFHLLQNLLEHLKDIFKEELPAKIFVRDGKVLDQEPQKIPQEKKPDDAFLAALHYDNTPPRNPDGTEMAYDNKKHDFSSGQYHAQAQFRKKKFLIQQVQEYWEGLDKKTIRNVAEAFGLSPPTAKKYIHMTETEITSLDAPVNYKKRDSPMNDWLNVIFKMMLDGQSRETIYFYILAQPEFHGKAGQVGKYIYLIGKNNFPDRPAFNINYLAEWIYPPDVTIISRTSLLKYLLTVNPRTQRDKEVGDHIGAIKEKFPAARVEEIFKEFHAILMGKGPDRLDGFLEQYGDSELKSFCNGIKKDITPVKNAISFDISSGFVEGNNNKFKLLKRIVYSRSGLVNLEKKCKLAFLPNNENFDLASLV